MAVEIILLVLSGVLGTSPYLSLDNNFYLGWEFSDSTITFTFNCYNIFSWCGLDFTYGMENTEMIVVQSSKTSATVTNYYSKAFEQPSTTIPNTLTLIYGVSNSSGIFASFSRNLVTDNKQNTDLYVGMVNPISFAYLTTANQGFSRHNNIGEGLLVLGNTKETSIFMAGTNIQTPSVVLDNNFTLSWVFTSEAIVFTFSCANVQGWCGITFVQGMMDTEMIIAYNNNSVVQLTDYYSLGYEQPYKLTGTVLEVIQSNVNSSGIFVTFSRPLVAATLDKTISIDLVTYLSFAYLTNGTEGFSRHNRIGRGTLVMGQYQSTSQFLPNPEDPPIINLDSNFTLSWEFLNNYIVFNFTVISIQCDNIQGWCGISFVHGMENTEMIVLQNTATGLTITDYYSTDFVQPTQKTGTTFQILESSITSTSISATFARLLSPGGLDTNLTAGQTLDFSYAYLTTGGTGFQHHNYQDYGALTLGLSNATSLWVPGGSSLANVTLDENFSLAWTFQDSNITFSASCFNIFSWCGFTFVQGMENTEMIIILNNAGSVSVSDYYSTAYTKPTVLTGTKFKVLSASTNSQGIFATFSRALSPSSSKDTKLSPGYITDFSFAYLTTPNQGLQKHNNIGTGLMFFGPTSYSAKFLPGATNTPYMSLDENFKLGWQFTTTTIQFTFNCYNIGSWCGVSFVHGMNNTEMIVALNTGNTITVTDYYSTAFQQPTTKTSLSLTVVSSVVNTTGLFVTFTRPLTSTSSQVAKINVGSEFDFSFAYLTPVNEGFQRHDNIGVGLITFGATNSSSNFIINGNLPTINGPYFHLIDGFYLGWAFSDTVITFTFNCFKIKGWCGISFGGGMDNVEMIIVENAGTTASAKSYYSRSETTPSQTSASLSMISSLVNSSGIFATFTRPLTGNPSNAANIKVGSQFTLGIAYLSTNTQSFTKHNSVTKGYITMGATNATSNFTFGGSDESIDLDYYRDHGIYMSVMWIGVAEMAIIMMRYFKWWRFSGMFHALFGTVALVTTLVSAYKTYKKDKTPYDALDDEDKDFLYHSRIAFTMCSLTLSQFLLGIFFKYTQIFKKNIKINNFSRLVHRILGWTLPLMGLVNIKFGWHLHGQTWKNKEYIYPAYGILVSVLFVFELNYKLGKLIRKNLTNLKLVLIDYYRGGNQGERQNLVENEKFERRRHCEVFDEIMNGKKEWVFYDEYILDISGFKWNHPGGTFIFKGIYGQDVGKFINGCSNVDDYRPYFHSEQARNIAEHLAIGYISFPANLFIPLHNNETNSNMTWTLTNRTSLAQSTFCLEFSSFNWQINPEPPGFEWIGKHFLITTTVSGRQLNRYYSFVNVNLQTWAEEVRSHSMKAKHYDIKQHPNKIRLHMKHYPGGEMSTKLSTMPLGSTVQLKGPIGPGLCTDSLRDKEFLVFGAGTGVLPFLDLIYAVWKGKASNCVLHVYVSFRDDASSFAVDLIEATAKVFPKNIKLYTRIGQKGYELNSEFWRNMLPLHLAEKAWICGPPVFNRKIEKILIEEGFNPGKIIMI